MKNKVWILRDSTKRRGEDEIEIAMTKHLATGHIIVYDIYGMNRGNILPEEYDQLIQGRTPIRVQGNSDFGTDRLIGYVQFWDARSR